MTVDLEQPAPICTASGCDRPQGASMTICEPDARRLGDWVAQLQSEYELLSADPSMQAREPGSGGGGTLASQRSPARLDVLTLTDFRTVMGAATDGTSYGTAAPKAIGPWCLFCNHDTCTSWRAGRRRDMYDDEAGSHRALSALGILHGWAQQVREGRDLAEPVTHVAACQFPCMHRSCLLGRGRPVPVPLTVARERKLLAAHLDWILGQDWAGSFFDEIRGLWQLLRRANGHASPTRRVLRLHVPCPDCGVRAVTYRPGDTQACCENCGQCTQLDGEPAAA